MKCWEAGTQLFPHLDAPFTTRISPHSITSKVNYKYEHTNGSGTVNDNCDCARIYAVSVIIDQLSSTLASYATDLKDVACN